jgi:hypothetical protein
MYLCVFVLEESATNFPLEQREEPRRSKNPPGWRRIHEVGDRKISAHIQASPRSQLAIAQGKGIG